MFLQNRSCLFPMYSVDTNKVSSPLPSSLYDTWGYISRHRYVRWSRSQLKTQNGDLGNLCAFAVWSALPVGGRKKNIQPVFTGWRSWKRMAWRGCGAGGGGFREDDNSTNLRPFLASIASLILPALIPVGQALRNNSVLFHLATYLGR